jgi:signal transduction histidine kinase
MAALSSRLKSDLHAGCPIDRDMSSNLRLDLSRRLQPSDYNLGWTPKLDSRANVCGVTAVLRKWWIDLLVIVVATLEQVFWWSDAYGRARPLAAVPMAASLLCLLARRRLPLASSIAAFALTGVTFWLSPANPPVVFAALLLVFCVSGIANPPRDAAIALGAGFLTVAYGSLVGPTAGGVGDFLLTALFGGIAWLGGMAFGSRTRRAIEAAETAVAAERTRIAREIHDVVAHGITVVVVQAVAAQEELEQADTATVRRLKAIEGTARDSLSEMRRLVEVLRTDESYSNLEPAPGLHQLGRLADQVSEAGLATKIQVEGEETPIPAGIALCIYRVTQEALTNALKHAGAHTATITLRYLDGWVEVETVDDGQAPASSDTPGRGLLGLRERVGIYGGRFEAGPTRPSGFRVAARLPLGFNAK